MLSCPRTLLRRDVAIVVGVHNILTAMEIAGRKRFIYLSADTLRTSGEDQSPVRRLLLSALLPNPTADHELNESMIRKVIWTDHCSPANRVAVQLPKPAGFMSYK
jgi:hypothetical protein